jgi:hypothetical protein
MSTPAKNLNLNILDQVSSKLVKVQAAARQLGPVEFVETIVDAFDVPLFLSQRVFLKTMFGDTMNAEEQALLDQWVQSEKTNWRDPSQLLTETNMQRVLEGKPEKPRFSYQNITFQAGMRSAKSSSVALAIVYEFFKHITSPCPQHELGVPKSSPIYITVIASTERQVLGTIFYYVKKYVTESTFFKNMIEQGEIVVRELDIECASKGVIIACGHSKATSIVGRTAVMVAFDELAMFSADEGHTSNAQDVYTRVGKSTATYKDAAKRIALSSVKCEGDFMEQLVREDWDRQRQGCLVFDLTTFDFNPTLSKDDSGIASDYVKDPVAAARDYENLRPGSATSFFMPAVIEKAAAGRDPQAVIAHQPQVINRGLGEAKGASQGETREMAGLQVAVTPLTHSNVISIGHCDPGLKRDSFGFAVGHAEWSEVGIVTVIDAVLEWMPKPLGRNKVAPVDLVNVEEVLIEIAKKRNMQRLTFDHWNSAGSIQRLFRENVVTREFHFSGPFQKKLYDMLRARLNAGLVRIPNHPTLIEELKHIELRNGESIAHPKNKDSAVPGRGKISKDLADCVAVVNWQIAQLEGNLEPGMVEGGMMGAAASDIRLIGQLSCERNVTWSWR